MRLLADNKWVYIKLILSSPFEGGQPLVIYLKAIIYYHDNSRTALRYRWGGGYPLVINMNANLDFATDYISIFF